MSKNHTPIVNFSHMLIHDPLWLLSESTWSDENMRVAVTMRIFHAYENWSYSKESVAHLEGTE